LNGGCPEIGPEITLTIPPLVNSKLAKTEFDERKINAKTRMMFFIKIMLILYQLNSIWGRTVQTIKSKIPY